MKRTKIRERQKSLFDGIGIPAAILFTIAFIFAQIGRNGPLLKWIDGLLVQAGLGFLGHFGTVLFVIIGGISAVVPAALLARRYMIKLQPLRDAEAKFEGPNALFLRPFFTDNTLFENPFVINWATAMSGVNVQMPFVGSEHFVGQVLEGYIQMREIGGSSQNIGMGRLYSTEKEWKILAKEAMHKASVIVVLPSFSKQSDGKTFGNGTMWELEELVRSGLIGRTIALMPKKIWYLRSNTAANWEEARSLTTKFGLVLPEYARKGGSVVFHQMDGVWQPAKKFGFEGSGRKRLANALVDALKWQAERHQIELLIK